MYSSTQFLFDNQCSGRSGFSLKKNSYPRKLWVSQLRSLFLAGAESTPVQDNEGNLYFGCHDGCFYSFDKDGSFRWMFHVGKKIYSSPIVYRNSVIVSSGDGYLLSFGFDGTLIWKFNTTIGYRSYKRMTYRKLKLFFKTLMENGINNNFSFTYKNWDCFSWSSPKVIENVVFITGYGKGLVAVDADTGEEIWSRHLGSPDNILAGCAITKNKEIIALSQQRKIFKFSLSGDLIWTSKFNFCGDNWSTPSIDINTGNIYVSSSFAERRACIYCFDDTGKNVWEQKVNAAIRGSIGISYKKYVIALLFNGEIIFLDKGTGKIIFSKNISETPVRALWTSCCIDRNGNILCSIKNSFTTGSVLCLDDEGNKIWEIADIPKVLSTPIIDKDSRIYFGTSRGEICCYELVEKE